MSKDKQQGTPWVTKLPFPVQVVEKVEAIDEISGLSLVTCYSYHHGYYDRIEREFRGFGRVERWDQELERKGQEASHFCKKLNSWSLTGRRGDGGKFIRSTIISKGQFATLGCSQGTRYSKR